MRQLGVVLPLVVPPSRPLTPLPSHPLIVHQLAVAWPPSNNAAAIKRPDTAATATATAVAAVGVTVVELTIIHCLRKRQQ